MRLPKASTTLGPTQEAVWAFWFTVGLQGFHQLEHTVQVFQRFALHDHNGWGILGSWVAAEPLHFMYNLGFLVLVALCYWLGGFVRKATRPRPLVFWLMTFSVVFQTYHFAEHVVKLAQYIETGKNGTPGILGNYFNLVWLHFTYNAIEYVPLVLVFILGGFYTAKGRHTAQAQEV